jgi:hypothetical protein
MTVSSTTSKASYTGNGLTTSFAVPFYFLAAADLQVILRSGTTETVQALTTNYTVSGAGNEAGGTVTMLVAPASGTTLTIRRSIAATQGTDLLPNDRLPAEDLEDGLDKLTMIAQQLGEESDRSIKYPASDAAVSAQLPAASARASKFLSFDSNGLPVATVGVDATTDIFTQAGTGAVSRSVNDKLRDMVSLKDFGVVGDGATDDRAALLLAKNYAISSGKGLWCPSGMTVRLGSSTDLRGVKRINFESNILIPTGTLTVGGFFNSGGGDIRFAEVTNGGNLFNPPPAAPVLRVTGVSESFISVGPCNYLQLYADAGIADDRAVAYNQFRLTGSVSLLEIKDSGVALSYVNENYIYADRVIRYKIIGVGYEHNHNKLFHPCLEGDGVELVFNRCSVNQVYGARFESATANPAVTFDSNTYSNTVIGSWSGAGNPYSQFLIPVAVSDSGEGNMVTSEAAMQFNKTPIISVNANSMIVGTATSSGSPDQRIGASANGLTNLSPAVITPSLAGFSAPTFELIAVSDAIPVKLGDVVYWDADYAGNLVRPIVWVLDENQKPLVSEGGGGAFYSQPNLTTFNTTYGSYTVGTGLAASALLPGAIVRSEVKFIRVGMIQSVGGLIKALGASIYTQALQRGPTENAARTSFSLPVVDGAPTRGYVPLNFTVWDKTAKVMRWVSYQFETNLNGALSAGGTSVTVAAAGSIANSDICGILLDDLTTHWSAISSLSGSTFTIAAIPAGKAAASGNRVVFNRWAS